MNKLQTFKTCLQAQKADLKQQYHVKELGIFGSYVRGEAKPNSDLDLLIEFEPEYRFGLLTFCHLENYLSELLGINVDLVIKDSLKPKIGQQILSEVIYI
ncbi:nucleotidyltransferase family protein [Crocosphaera chwakensis]|nr:nucleotidyltransferase [Crocosphaera chwakensis]